MDNIDSRLAAVWQSINWSSKYENSTPRSANFGTIKYCWYASEASFASQVLALLPEHEVKEDSFEVIPKEWLTYHRRLVKRKSKVTRSIHLAHYQLGYAIVVCEEVEVLSVKSSRIPQSVIKKRA